MPVGKEAHTIRARYDLLEVGFHFSHGQMLVDILANGEGRKDREGELSNDTDSSQSDDTCRESVRVLGSGEREPFATGGNDFQGCYGGGEAAVAVPGTVRPGCAGSCDRDMGQGSQVVEGIAPVVQVACELTVADAGLYGDSGSVCIERQDLITVFEGDHVLGGVGDVVERMPSSKRFDMRAFGYKFLNLLHRFGVVPALGGVGKVACPIRLKFDSIDAPLFKMDKVQRIIHRAKSSILRSLEEGANPACA